MLFSRLEGNPLYIPCEQVTEQVEEIHNLKSQVQQMRVMASQAGLLRAGTKRGRFVMSAPKMLECSQCHGVFESEVAARSAKCSYHPLRACKLSKKMVGEFHEGECLSTNHRYWPCCQRISVETPESCQGDHQLRAL